MVDHNELDVIESKLSPARTNIVIYIVIGFFGGLVAAMTTSLFGLGYFAILAAYSLGGAFSIFLLAAFIVYRKKNAIFGMASCPAQGFIYRKK